MIYDGHRATTYAYGTAIGGWREFLCKGPRSRGG
jgi:hypothetical protein